MEVTTDCKLADIPAIYKVIKKFPGSYRPVSLTCMWNFMGKVILGTIEMHLEIM